MDDHDENTVLLIQGRGYRLDENGRHLSSEDNVHKCEQDEIFLNESLNGL